MRTSDWLPVQSPDDWQRLDELVLGLHDGVVREFFCVHGNYVSERLQIVYTTLPILWVLIQLQYEKVPAVEFLFVGLQKGSFETTRDARPSVEFGENSLTMHFLNCTVIAEKCLYRVRDERCLGPARRTPEFDELFPGQ